MEVIGEGYPGYMTKIKGYNKQGPNLQTLERVSNYDYKPKADINEIRAKLAENRLAKQQMHED